LKKEKMYKKINLIENKCNDKLKLTGGQDE